MRYSIITPTLVRPTLKRLCESIDAQTNGDWEHIIMVDVPLILNPAKRAILDELKPDSRRKIFRCGKSHKNFGNTCRYNAWEKASGDYILYIDDDDYYADDRVLETLTQVTAPWAIFPCLRVGVYWLLQPPGIDKTGSAMMMHKRTAGRYHDPDRPDYEQTWAFDGGKTFSQLCERYPQMKDTRWGWIKYAADGLLAEELKSKYPYQVVNDRPLTVYECANKGRE